MTSVIPAPDGGSAPMLRASAWARMPERPADAAHTSTAEEE
jgi:hypothetical protein